MRRGGGKAKGSQFERDICKQLSLTVSGGTRRDLFWRSAMSGGTATRFNRNTGGQRNLTQMGDISSIAAEGNWLTERYLLECKHTKDMGLDNYLLNNGGKIAQWVSTMEQQQLVSGLKGILIMKQNMIDTLVLTRERAIVKADQTAHFQTLLQMANGYYLTRFTDVCTAIAAVCGPPIRRRPRA